MSGKMTIEVVASSRTAAELWRTKINFGTHAALDYLSQLFAEMVSGLNPSACRIVLADSVGVSASQTAAPVFASLAAGDVLTVQTPSGESINYTGQTTAVTLGDPTFRIQTDAATTGASLVAQINADPRANGRFTAAGTTTVTITITQKGSLGNSWTLKKTLATAAGFTLGGTVFAGGKDPGQLQNVTLTLSGVIANNETLAIGGVTLTGKSSAPSGENQFLCNVSAAADGAALVAAINAHSVLKAWFVATGTATPSITCQLSGSVGTLISIVKVITNGTLSAATFAPSTTETATAFGTKTLLAGATLT